MSFCKNFAGFVGKAVCSFLSWLLALFLRHTRPAEELPITTSGSHQTMSLLEAFHTDSQACTSRDSSTKNVDIRQEGDRKNATHASRSKPHSLSFPRCPQEVSPNSNSEGPLLSATQRTRSFPNFIMRCPSPWTLSTSSVGDSDVRDRLSFFQDVDLSIGELGQRRGFKGAPLLTSATNLRNSILLALPASFSPRSAGSFSASFPSPRTPFDAVAQRMRSASASAAIRSSRAFGADVAEELQALYDEADPFDLSGDSAFFVSGCASALDPKADLNRFEPYRRNFKTHQRTISLKGNGSFERIRSAALQKKTWSMKTTIYDLSTADVAPNRAPVVRSATVTRRRAATMPSSIVFTTTNSPDLVSSASVSPIKVSSEAVGDDLRGLRPVTDPLLTIQRRPVLGDIQNYPSKNVDTLLTKPAGTCPSPAHYRHSTDALPGPRSTLRPLILPGRIASRIAMTDTADLLRPVTTDTGCRSKGLDDIIALLEARDGSSDNVVDVEGPSEEEPSRTSYAL